jgi:uncharacterized SAM-binding protein YcdF (DUF218 family)
MSLVRALGITALAVFALAAFTPLAGRLYGWFVVPSRIEPADAIVVMAAGGVRRDGRLSDDSRRRAAFAIDLYREGLAPLLVLSGLTAPGSESGARATLAGECGVPPSATLAVPAGFTTHEEVATLAPLLRARGVRRVLLVTDGSHMRRTLGLFAHARFEVLPAPVRADGASKPSGRLQLFHETLRESLALLYYAAAGYR